VIALVGGVFRFLMRRIIVGLARTSSTTCGTTSSRTCSAPREYFQAPADRRPDVARHQRPQRRAHDDRPGRHVLRQRPSCSSSRSHDALDRPVADAGGAARAAAVRVGVGEDFGSAIHRRFERIQAQLSDISAVVQEALPGVRVVRAYRQEQAELERFRRANQEYVRATAA
jgi:ABC-type multidrug transport system fused ATPase/permease subunit